jgi:hypothetical protein
MILELCQLLSVSWHILDQKKAKKLEAEGKIYKKTHANHPCAIWTRAHVNNYNYVVYLGLELCNEWRLRYNHPRAKKHGCEEKLIFLLDNPPNNIPKYKIEFTKQNPKGFTLPMPQAMPPELKINPDESSPLQCQKAYRNYYNSEFKEHLREWKKREKPYWFYNTN